MPHPHEGQSAADNYVGGTKKAWDTWFKTLDIESEDANIVRRFGAKVLKAVDFPATWFRESVVLPLREKHQRPYYHRKFGKATEIDECSATDHVCIFEANHQYRLGMQVDGAKLQILKERMFGCLDYYGSESSHKCVQQMEDYEENELNYFIKYGEMTMNSDSSTAYMKQKHRLIWERRHPKVMEERRLAVEKHKQDLAEGNYNPYFWKTGGINDKAEIPAMNKMDIPFMTGKRADDDRFYPQEGSQAAPLDNQWMFWKDKYPEDSGRNNID